MIIFFLHPELKLDMIDSNGKEIKDLGGMVVFLSWNTIPLLRQQSWLCQTDLERSFWNRSPILVFWRDHRVYKTRSSSRFLSYHTWIWVKTFIFGFVVCGEKMFVKLAILLGLCQAICLSYGKSASLVVFCFNIWRDQLLCNVYLWLYRAFFNNSNFMVFVARYF